MNELDLATTQLNFHHLRYFWLVAREGHLTRTAEQLRVSQSALSNQIRQLEEALGERLFRREGRSLALTEVGQVVRDHADDVFGAGGRLVVTLREGRRREDTLRIGAVATLSRNFQDSFLQPLFATEGARVRLESGSFDDLVERLSSHGLDLVLANRPVRGEAAADFRCLRIANQPVALIGHPRQTSLRFPDDIEGLPMLLPTHDNEFRLGFDELCARHGVSPRILAEVDDMALLRLLARDTDAVSLMPSVVVRDELISGVLQEHLVVPGLFERFYALSVPRRFQHPLLKPLLARNEEEILAMG